MESTDNLLLDMFGLTYEQTVLLFSTQHMMTLWDIKMTKDPKLKESKALWLDEWTKNISNYLSSICGDQGNELIDAEDLNQAFGVMLKAENNFTWYYILILELIAFVPYTPLGTENDKRYEKCKPDSILCFNRLKKMVIEQKVISGPNLEKIRNTYNKNIDKISGKKSNMVRGAIITVAVTAVTAAMAAAFAGQIAVSLFGGAFHGLHGIALTNACLAMLGAGAVAAG